MSGGGWRAVVVGRDPVGNGRGDVAVISPADDKMVILVGGGSVACGNYCGTNWRRTWSCCPWGVWGVVGRLFFGPGIAKPRPGKSGQGGGFVLPANYCKVGLEFFVLCWGNGARSYMTSFVVAVNEAFALDVPAGAHKSGVVPLGTIFGAFPGKMLLPILAILYQKLGDGGNVFDQTLPVNIV